jgi:hypothetical protein
MSKNLAKLYKEKKSLPQKVDESLPKEKKIKKKDIILEPIETRELQYYEYDVVNDINIYNGVLIDKKETILNNIDFYKIISPNNIFTDLFPSTLTARGAFTNTSFTEEEFMKTLHIPSIDFASILKIGCNFGEIYVYPHALINHDIGTMVKSVSAMNGKNIKIGCSCNPELLDVGKVLELSKIINKDTEEFESKFKKYIKDKLPTDKKFTKKKSTKILKNFQDIQNFKVLDTNSIKELYDVMEFYISDVELCNTYLDNLVQMIKIFTDYEEECKCIKKFTAENDLSNMNRDELVKSKKNSTRGRKPKEKKKMKRKVQGSGMYFSSQISFDIYNYHNNKISKIKLFRNGNIQIPGISSPAMTDLLDSVILLKNYLNSLRTDTNVEIPYIIAVMRNYTSRLVNPNVTIILNKLEDVLYFEKSMPLHKDSSYIKFLESIPDVARYEVFKYFNIAFDSISEVMLNSERYPGLLIKFNRPIPGKDTKKLTVKILSSGKINFDGASSEIEALEVYYWLQYIFFKYWDEITYDSSIKMAEIVSSDSASGYESIYDSD